MVFPVNVPKSVYSYDYGSQVQFPELNVTYSYLYREDLSPVALVEFNENAGVGTSASNVRYVKPFNSKTQLSNNTWVGTPFVHSFIYNDGIQSGVQGFKLGWKEA